MIGKSGDHGVLDEPGRGPGEALSTRSERGQVVPGVERPIGIHSGTRKSRGIDPKRDSVNKQVLFPYLNGEDLNSRPDQSPSRWVINFRDWPLDRKSAPVGYKGPVATDFLDCIKIVSEKIKPEGERNAVGVSARTRWWLHERARPDLYTTIEGMNRVLVTTQTSRTQMPALISNGAVISTKVVVFGNGSYASFALLLRVTFIESGP